MTETKLKTLVAEAVALDREIAEKTETLKELKAQLVAEAESREDDHTVTEGGGKSWVTEGADGSVARVTFPSPSLKSKIDGEGKAIEKVRAAAHKCFDMLFRPSITFKPVDNFREEATRLLGGQANKLIKLCQSESTPKVAFETKERA